MGFPFEVVRVHAEGRANLTISDKQGLTIKLNEIGAPLQEKKWARSATWWKLVSRKPVG